MSEWINGELQEFFDIHILYDSEINKKMIKDSEPFVQWALNVEEESEEDSEDEESESCNKDE